MNEETCRHAQSDDTEKEQQGRNHWTASLSVLRQMQCQRRGLALLSSGRADARQPGLATNRGVAMNNSALRRFVDGRDECSDVGGLSARVSCALAQGASSTQDLAIAQSAALGLACTFGGGFGISHGKK